MQPVDLKIVYVKTKLNADNLSYLIFFLLFA